MRAFGLVMGAVGKVGKGTVVGGAVRRTAEREPLAANSLAREEIVVEEVYLRK